MPVRPLVLTIALCIAALIPACDQQPRPYGAVDEDVTSRIWTIVSGHIGDAVIQHLDREIAAEGAELSQEQYQRRLREAMGIVSANPPLFTFREDGTATVRLVDVRQGTWTLERDIVTLVLSAGTLRFRVQSDNRPQPASLKTDDPIMISIPDDPEERAITLITR